MCRLLGGLIEAINSLTNIRRDELYFVLALPADGLAIERALLPDLPASKALVLTDDKRALRIAPYKQWMEQRLKTGSVVMDKKSVKITVQK